MFQTRIIKKQLHFKQPAGTSRGVYTTRNVWYILLTDTDNRYYGVGECAPLPALSCDDVPNYDELLAIACKNFEKTGEIDREALLPYPSILFGLETALLHFRACSLQFWHTPFSKGKAGIPINGLIWMGSFDEMYRRIEEKMQKGFRWMPTVPSLPPMLLINYSVFPSFTFTPSNSLSAPDSGKR